MRIRKVTGVLIGAAVLFALAAPAAAQDKTLANAGVGYQFIHQDKSIPGKQNLTKGMLLSAAGRLNDVTSGLLEVGASFDTPSGFGALKDYSIGTGLRFAAGSGKKIEPFGQFVVAWQRRSGKFLKDSTGVNIPGSNPATITGSTTSDGLDLRPGAGVDMWLNKTVGVRAQADFMHVRVDSHFTNNVRVAISVIFQGVKK